MSTQLAIADAMAAKVREANPTIAAHCIRRVYDIVVEDENALLELIPDHGVRRAWIVPLLKAYTERADRAFDRHSYSFGVLATNRAEGSMLVPDFEETLNQWADDLIGWVDTNIYRPLAATTFAPVPGAIIEPGGAFIDELIRIDLLMKHGIFWSGLSFTYTLDEANH